MICAIFCIRAVGHRGPYLPCLLLEIVDFREILRGFRRIQAACPACRQILVFLAPIEKRALEFADAAALLVRWVETAQYPLADQVRSQRYPNF